MENNKLGTPKYSFIDDNVEVNARANCIAEIVKLKDKRIMTAFSFLKNESINRILDIGCQSGDFLSLFGSDVEKHGVDFIPRNVIEGIHFHQHDVSNGLQFPSNFFDAIFAGEIIEHLIDTGFFLKECKRVLKSGGVLVLTTPNLASWGNIIQALRGKQLILVDYKAGQNGHVRYYTPQTIKSHLIETGFILEKLKTVKFDFYSPSLIGKVVKFLTMVLSKLIFMNNKGFSIVVKARKP